MPADKTIRLVDDHDNMSQDRYAMMDHINLPLNQRDTNPFRDNYENRGLTKYQRTS